MLRFFQPIATAKSHVIRFYRAARCFSRMWRAGGRARFLANRQGHFGLMTAILMVPLLGIAGLTVDVARLLDIRERMQQAGDAAALDAVASANLARSLTPGPDGIAFTRSLGVQAEKAFRQQVEPALGEGLTVTQASAVTLVDPHLQASLVFQADVPTTFLRVLGVETLHTGGRAAASSISPHYMTVTLLVDNSPSMGIGATPAAMDQMRQLVDCVFACHVPGEDDTFDAARAAGIPLRIDTVAQAVEKMTAAVEANRISPDQYTMNLYTLGATSIEHLRSYLTQIGHKTTDTGLFRQYARQIALMHMPETDFNGRIMTYIHHALDQMNKIIPTPGSGKTVQEPDQLLIVISDGLSNSVRGGCTRLRWKVDGLSHCQEPIDPRFCTAIKKRGIRIATLYTTFLPVPEDNWYATTIAPFQKDIPLGMQACASPGLYFEVGFDDDMDAVLQSLFSKASALPRLTD